MKDVKTLSMDELREAVAQYVGSGDLISELCRRASEGEKDRKRLDALDERRIHKIFFDDGTELSPRSSNLRAAIDGEFVSLSED